MPTTFSPNASRKKIHAVLLNIFSAQNLRISWSLAKVNFKLRNEGSYLGILWYLLSPLALFVTILFVRRAAFVDTVTPMYPLYLLIGLIALNYLGKIILFSIECIRSNAGFIKSTHLPIEIFVLSSTIHVMFLHAFEAGLVIALSLYLGVAVSHICIYIVALLLMTVMLVGLAFLCASVGAYVTDIGNIWAIASQLLFFGTPIFYVLKPGNMIYVINQFNPLYHMVALARGALIDGTFSPYNAGAVGIFAALFLFLGISVFARNRNKFVEVI